MTTHTRHRFTLLEIIMVAVLGIMLLFMTVAVFDSFGGGSRADAAVRTVASQLRLGRQLAAVHRRKVAVVMPGPNASGTGESQYGCCRMAFVTGSGATYTWEEWLENTAWGFLPTGTAIMEADDDAGIATAGNYVKDPTDDNYTKVDGVPLTTLGAGTLGGIRAAVFAPTGRLLGPTEWITVGDAVYTGGSWVIRNPDNSPTNKSCPNQQTLRLDQFTGRVSVLDTTEYP